MPYAAVDDGLFACTLGNLEMRVLEDQAMRLVPFVVTIPQCQLVMFFQISNSRQTPENALSFLHSSRGRHRGKEGN
jgi:hypothetical protein